MLLAHANGCRPWRIALAQIVPNLLPIAAAQFLVTVPAFLLAEANLGLLGLGAPEPLPSLGGARPPSSAEALARRVKKRGRAVGRQVRALGRRGRRSLSR